MNDRSIFHALLSAAALPWLALALLALPVPPAGAQVPPAGTSEATLYAAAKKEGKLVWYTDMGGDRSGRVAKAFMAQYPGIDFVPQVYPPQTQFQRFSQETAAHQYIADNIGVSDRPTMQALVAAGDLAEWRIPDYDRYAADAHIGLYTTSPYAVADVVAYNATKVSPQEADLLAADWKAILDPRFKGRFAVIDQKSGPIYPPLFMFLDPKLADRYGVNFLKGIAAQKPTLFTDANVAADRLAAGEIDFIYWIGAANVAGPMEKGAPIRWVYPNPTPNAPLGQVGVSKFAPHPNAARLFEDWLFSADGAKNLQIIEDAPSTMQGLPDERPATKEPWYKPPQSYYPIDFTRWSADFDKDLTLWHNMLVAAQ